MKRLGIWLACTLLPACASAASKQAPAAATGGELSAAMTMAPAALAPEGGAAAPESPAASRADKLVITGNVSVVAEDVVVTARAVRAQVAAAGGDVVSDRLEGAADRKPRAHMRLRVPPAAVDAFLEWLAAETQVQSRLVEAQDVSREFFDQQLAIKNLEVTAQRLQRILSERAGALAEVLEVERELTRVRGELERLQGAHRFLQDRIARATIELQIEGREGYVALAPEMKFRLVPSADLLAWVDRRGRERARVGGGVALLFSRHFGVELKIFPGTDRQARAFLFGLTTALYSDFLGGGRRRFGNPYLGLALGGGSINDRGTFTAGADLGVELFRGRWLLVDLRGRAQAFLYGDDDGQDPRTDIGLSGILSLGVPF